MLSPERMTVPPPRFSRGVFFVLCCVLGASLLVSGQIKAVPAADKGGTAQPKAPARKIDSYTITQRGDRYRVSITYPNLGNAVADTELAIWVRDQASTFTQSVQMIPAPDPMPYELFITYETHTASSRVISVVFFISTAMGGAHPEPGLATFAYEKHDGRRLTYADLFLNSDGLLEALSDICRTTLSEQLGDRVVPDMLKAGTEPDVVNFDLFVPTAEGLRIYFPPYQAAPYSEGYLFVTVPLDKLDRFKPQKSLWDKE